MPSKPRMPIPTSALLRPNVTLKATKEWVWFSSSVSEISFRYESIYASLNLDLTPPFVEQNINIIQVTWSYCSHSHHHLGCNKILRNVEVPKMPSSINQVADGQRDGLLLLQKRFLSKENLCFFFLRWNNHITCPSKYDKCFTKQPFAVNFFKCLWLLALFSSQCMACLISLTTAPFCFGETRQQMTSWSQQGWVSCCDVVRMWNLLTHAGYERNDASHFSRHKRTENTCLSDTRLADFGNAGRGTVVQVRQIATKSCRLFEWLLIGWGKGCASTKILKTLTFM